MAKQSEPPKVMDVVHPSGERRPSPTSRPVIVSDRSYMAADPMLSVTPVADNAATVESPEQQETVSLSGAPEVKKAASATGAGSGEELRVEPPAADGATDSQTEAVATPATEPAPAEEPPQGPSETAATPEVSHKHIEPLHPSAFSSTEKSETDTTSNAADDASSDNDASDTDTDEPAEAQPSKNPDEAAINARKEELERLIASGTYAVPINTVKRRQMRLVLLFLAGLLVVLIALDLLADMGTITLPFGLPHTTFLSR